MLWFILFFILSLLAWRAVIKETFKDVPKEEKEHGKIANILFFGYLLVIFVGVGTLLACIPNGIIRANSTADVETYCKEQVEIALIPYASGEGTVYLLLGMSDSSYCNFYYYRDTVTDVVYLWGRAKAGYAGMGGLTVMMDPETGLPLTYDRWGKMYQEIISPNQ